MRKGDYHDLFDFSPIIDRPPLRWPNGARVALWVVPNIEHFELLGPGGAPDVRNVSQREYGNRVGIWRLMEVLDRHQVRGTVALNASVCRHYPRVVEAALQRDWELMGHGLTNSEQLAGLPPGEARAVVEETVATLHEATGRSPRGWLGPGLAEAPGTLAELKAAGIDYVCDWANDDQPYRMRNGIHSIPYTLDLNDLPVIGTAGHSAAEFGQMVRDSFDTLYREGEHTGRVMCIALHPFIIATPSRIRYLDEALAYICSHPLVWRTTGSQIIDWYASQTDGSA